MKKVLFVINTLGGAGAEKALLELLKRFSPEQYQTDLYVLLEQGELISQVPEYVNILNRDYTAESVLTREGKKKRSIIKGKIFELEVDKPESVKDKNLTWSIKDSSIVTFAGKERHDDDIKFKALKAGTTKITCRNTKTDKKINFKITVKNVKKTTKGYSQNKTNSAKGSLKRSIRVNDELELEVKKTKGKGVKDRQLKWTVEDSTILAFEDMDDGIYDDEMEFVGIKPGKTTVTCTNTANKEKVTFLKLSIIHKY